MSDQPEPVEPDPDKKPKWPRDANQLAKFVVDLATGGASEKERKANEYLAEAGKKGGISRANSLSAEERSQIAKIAAQSRWAKDSGE